MVPNFALLFSIHYGRECWGGRLGSLGKVKILQNKEDKANSLVEWLGSKQSQLCCNTQKLSEPIVRFQRFGRVITPMYIACHPLFTEG